MAQFEYLELNSLLAAEQFWFRMLRSVEDQLLLAYSGCVVDVVFLYFSKAFDVVSHFIVLSKLQILGIGGKLLV